MPAALQSLPRQQTWFRPPQAVHCPLAHTASSPLGQEVPQHGCPAPPQVAQLSLAVQTVAPEHFWLPSQHGLPFVPQAVQLPCTQR